MSGTLVIGSATTRSPIGEGLSVVSSVVGRRAEAISGRSVWLVDESDPEGAYLAEPWSKANIVLLDAALAFGAPDLTSSADQEVLRSGWRVDQV
jgi:hypothetical protein